MRLQDIERLKQAGETQVELSGIILELNGKMQESEAEKQRLIDQVQTLSATVAERDEQVRSLTEEIGTLKLSAEK